MSQQQQGTQQQNSESQNKILKELNSLYQEQKYDLCTKKYHEYVDKNVVSDKSPFAADLCERVASAYFMKDNYPNALKYYEVTRSVREKMQPNSVLLAASYKNLGLVHKSMANFTQAIDNFEQSIKIKEDIESQNQVGKQYIEQMCQLRSNIALCYKAQGQFEQAAKQVQLCIELRQNDAQEANSVDNAKSFNLLGLLYKEMQNGDQALKYMLQANGILQKLAPKQVEFSMNCFNIANLYAGMQQFEQALPYYDLGLKVRKAMPVPVSKNLAAMCLKKAVCETRLNRLQDAISTHIEEFKIHASLDAHSADHVACLLNIACLYEKNNQKMQSSEWLHKAFAAYMDNDNDSQSNGYNKQKESQYSQVLRCRVAKALSKTASEGGAPENVAKQLRRALKCYDFLPPYHPCVLLTKFKLAQCLLRMSKPDEAIQLLQEILSNDSQFKWAFWLSAKAFSDKHDTDQASKMLEQALKVDPSYFDAVLMYARLALSQSKFESAKRVCEPFATVQKNISNEFDHKLKESYTTACNQTHLERSCKDSAASQSPLQKQLSMAAFLVRDNDVLSDSDFQEFESLEEVVLPTNELSDQPKFLYEIYQILKQIQHVSSVIPSDRTVEQQTFDLPAGNQSATNESACACACSIF